MHDLIAQLLENEIPSREVLVELLKAEGSLKEELFNKAIDFKETGVGNLTHLRGLIELSNVCRKDCYYCGIRKSNTEIERYTLTDDEVIEAATFAYEQGFGYVAVQGGELNSHRFIRRIDKLVTQIKAIGDHPMGITLSLGEQTEKVYRRWKELGANRFLLRIESSDPQLFKEIHPEDALHNFDERVESLKRLKRSGLLTGTGVMIGLPGQSIEQLAGDLQFMKGMKIDMCGMGPYLEQHNTPLFNRKDELWPKKERMELTLKMIALLRIMMPHINIAAATAMQSIDENGRAEAIRVGANVVMPNVTPICYKSNYALYDNKSGFGDRAVEAFEKLKMEVREAGSEMVLFGVETH